MSRAKLIEAKVTTLYAQCFSKKCDGRIWRTMNNQPPKFCPVCHTYLVYDFVNKNNYWKEKK